MVKFLSRGENSPICKLQLSFSRRTNGTFTIFRILVSPGVFFKRFDIPVENSRNLTTSGSSCTVSLVVTTNCKDTWWKTGFYNYPTVLVINLTIIQKCTAEVSTYELKSLVTVNKFFCFVKCSVSSIIVKSTCVQSHLGWKNCTTKRRPCILPSSPHTMCIMLPDLMWTKIFLKSLP